MNSQTYTTLDAIADMFIIYGIVIVISMLVALLIRGIAWVLSRQAAQVEAKAPAPKPVPVMLAGIPLEHLAVISAAVASMMGTQRIVRIDAPGRGYSWTAEARAAHHTSHAPRGSY